MKTKEEAYAVGLELKDILQDMMLKYGDAMAKLDGSDLKRMQAESIRQTIETVHKQIRPNVINIPPIDADARRERSFEQEYERLMAKVIAFYSDSVRHAHPAIAALLAQPANVSLVQQHEESLRQQLEHITLPLLDQHPAPGDDLYLYILACMRTLDDQVTLAALKKSERTPPEEKEAFFAMFGLLLQAERAKRDQDMVCAMSYLFDVHHLLGLHEGARYAMRHLPVLTKSLHGKRNAEKKLVEKNKAKRRAMDLFNTLRPRDSSGKPQMWQSSEQALKAVWDALVKEAIEAGEKNPKIADSTVHKVCKNLYRSDKKGVGHDIRVDLIGHLPDGTQFKIPMN